MTPIIGFARGLEGHPSFLQSFAFSYAWLEAPIDARLARLTDVSDWRDLTVWPAGRVFGKLGEYRWQHSADDSIHAVLLLENGLLPEEFSPGVPLQQAGESALILWGDWVDPEKDRQGNPNGGPLFYANEIPRVQAYPLDLRNPPEANQTPRLVIRRYRAVEEEAGEFVRCVDFIMKSREKED